MVQLDGGTAAASNKQLETLSPSGERFIGRERRNAEMLEASAKSSIILSALPDHLSSSLFARATARHLGAGETLFNIGDDGNGCYRLDRGVLKVSQSMGRH
jgi:CRP-like cAMP-binding protein